MLINSCHHARDQRGPLCSSSRRRVSRPARNSSRRPMSQIRSDRRLRYGTTCSFTSTPVSARRTTQRSARRQIVRATSKAAAAACSPGRDQSERSEEHTSELQSPYVISYAVFCLKKKKKQTTE